MGNLCRQAMERYCSLVILVRRLEQFVLVGHFLLDIIHNVAQSAHIPGLLHFPTGFIPFFPLLLTDAHLDVQGSFHFV